MQTHSKAVARIGVPWRTTREEATHKRGSYDKYLASVRNAGGTPVEISLSLPADDLAKIVSTLGGILLPGSPADVDTTRYGSARHALTADMDSNRERTDDFLLDHAFAREKPVLAICYGMQLLNVHLGGSLVQDIPSEVQTGISHDAHAADGGKVGDEAFHPVGIVGGSELAALAAQGGSASAGDSESAPAATNNGQRRVNSSHHQAIREPAGGLLVTAHAADGVIEAVEWTGGGWVMGVQWHPERMLGDPFAEAIFRKFVGCAEYRAG
jgi:putative glutamine amidotransferase